MFKFFQRSVPAAKVVEVRRPERRAPEDAQPRHDIAPAPLPEIIEGDGEADWSLWEDSVNLDSQLQPVSGFREAESQDVSAFDKVGKRDR